MRLQLEKCENRHIPQMRNPHNGEMDIVKIRKGLEKPGKSQRGLAQALGVDPTAVSRLLNGQRQLKLSEVPKVEAYLASSTGPEPEKGTGASNAADLTSTGGVAFNKELPRLSVLGMAETGPDGWSLWNGDVIDTLPRPSFLAGAKDAYAVYITGNSMEHRYYAGEAAYIHPGRPVTVGAFVLVQLKPKADGDPPRAVLKRLVRRSGTKTVLEQFNPPKTFEIKNDEILSMHRVVGSVEA